MRAPPAQTVVITFLLLLLSLVLLLASTKQEAIVKSSSWLRNDKHYNGYDETTIFLNDGMNDAWDVSPSISAAAQDSRDTQVAGAVGQIIKLRLINVTSGLPIIDPLTNGTIINLNNYPRNNSNLSIEAVVASTTAGPVGSVRFAFAGNNKFRTESSAPFTLCGDAKGRYFFCRELSIPGTYTTTVTPFSLIRANGTIGQSYTVSFTVVLPTPTLPPTSAPILPPVALKTSRPILPPMLFQTSISPPAPTPVLRPPTNVPIQPSAWINVATNSTKMEFRHESCFVMVGRKAYALGGRGLKSVSIYDPIKRVWSAGARSLIVIHHGQCVVVKESIYIVSSWTGNFPREPNVDKIHIYNTTTNKWSMKPGLPEERLRGGAASVLVGDRIYVSHGNRGGHETDNFATSLGYLDYYDLTNETWHTNLPDAPNPRDHTGGALVNGRICVAGGRDGGDKNFFRKPVLPTDCYDPVSNIWSVEANIPTGRAGSAYGRTCDGKLMVAGGEGYGGVNGVFSDVNVFNGTSWTTIDNLNVARHGTALAMDCICNQIYIAGGAATSGRDNETKSVEIYFPGGVDVPCLA